MPWPNSTNYFEAIQNPRSCFADPELRQGEPAVNKMGLPILYSGNFAAVFQVRCPGKQIWAVKCFTRQVPGLQQRYLAISEYLRKVNLPFMVDFQYLEEGIRAGGKWYAVLKMRWVEGLALNRFVEDYLDKPKVLDRLAQAWVKLAQELHRTGIAHGDLQHGNVLLIPSSKAAALSLRLIDYDGMFVPALAENRPPERGHPNYQHPQRQREGTYHAEIDRFSHLVVYTALRSLMAAGRALWKPEYDDAENLLFREADFQDPANSALVRELWQTPDADVQALIGHLVLANQGPLEKVPLLHELVIDGHVRSLTPDQEQLVLALVGTWPAAVAPRVPTASGAGPAVDAEKKRPWWLAVGAGALRWSGRGLWGLTRLLGHALAKGLRRRWFRFGAVASVLLVSVAACLVALSWNSSPPASNAKADDKNDPAKATQPAAVSPSEAAWIASVAMLSPEKQIEEVIAKLKERNPRFDGKVAAQRHTSGAVIDWRFMDGIDTVTDLSPLRALPELVGIRCHSKALIDLSPLQGLKLTFVDCTFSGVADLGPLKGMPLINLSCGSTPVASLAPLAGMKLLYLSCKYTQVTDLSPLKGMPLQSLDCSATRVTSLAPLTGMKLGRLTCRNAPVTDLSPLQGMTLDFLDCRDIKATDLSPLKNVAVKNLECDFPERHAAVLQSMKTLQTINGRPAAEFWK